MSILKKLWVFILVGMIVGIGAFIFGRSQAPQGPITIYKAVQPSQLETDRQAQNIATEIDRQASQTPGTPPQGSVQSEAQGSVLPPGGDIVTDTSIDPASEMTESVVDGSDEDKAPSLSAEELRRQELLQQRASIHEQLQTLVPPGHTVHSADDPELMSQLLELREELVQIEGKLNGYIDTGALSAINLSKTMNRNLDQDGNLSVIGAEEVADFFQQDGKPEVAERLRLVIQNARKNGDEIIRQEHLIGLE